MGRREKCIRLPNYTKTDFIVECIMNYFKETYIHQISITISANIKFCRLYVIGYLVYAVL